MIENQKPQFTGYQNFWLIIFSHSIHLSGKIIFRIYDWRIEVKICATYHTWLLILLPLVCWDNCGKNFFLVFVVVFPPLRIALVILLFHLTNRELRILLILRAINLSLLFLLRVECLNNLSPLGLNNLLSFLFTKVYSKLLSLAKWILELS